MHGPSRTNQELQEENAILVQKIQELQESESSYKMLFANAAEGILMVELRTKQLIHANSTLCKMFGYPEEEILQLSLQDIHPKDSLKHVLAEVNAMTRGEKMNLQDIPCLRKDGTAFSVNISGSLIDFHGKKCMAGFFTDITERKRVEESLRESEMRFRAIADYTPDWENWVGVDGKLLWINPSVFDFIGYTVEECLKMDRYPMDIIDEDDRERMERLFLEAVAGSSGNDVECRIVCRDGTKKWIATSWQPMYDAHGNHMGHRTSIRDISDRKALEEALRREKNFAESLIQTAQVIVLVLDTEGRIITFNSYLEKISGYRLEEVQGKEWFPTFLAERDRERVKQVFLSAVAGSQNRGYINPIVLKDGRTAEIEWHDKSLKDEKGNVLGVLAIGQDVTERLRSEMELKKAHDELEIRVQERTQELAKVIETLEVNEKLLADESYRLQEANTALKVLLQHREEDQQEMEKTVLANIRKLVLPYVEKLQVTPLTPAQAGLVDIVSANLQNVASPFLRNITATYLDFTPREIDVANLVCEGKSAKEIALLLNCATRSVEFHKDNIRRKLGITHQKTNLRTHLLSLTKT